MPVRVKICGITREEDARRVEALGAWAVGLVFAPSKRRVSPEQAAVISRALGPFIRRVGVFVDTPPEAVLEVARAARLDAVQLHGDEPPEWAETLREHLPVIKAVRLEGPPDAAVLAYPADALLVDGPRPGSGEAYDWAWLEPLAQHPRLIVAGGLNPENLPRLLQRVRPYGVDVSSGVEVRPGVKDWGRMAAFLRAARACG